MGKGSSTHRLDRVSHSEIFNDDGDKNVRHDQFGKAKPKNDEWCGKYLVVCLAADSNTLIQHRGPWVADEELPDSVNGIAFAHDAAHAAIHRGIPERWSTKTSHLSQNVSAYYHSSCFQKYNAPWWQNINKAFQWIARDWESNESCWNCRRLARPGYQSTSLDEKFGKMRKQRENDNQARNSGHSKWSKPTPSDCLRPSSIELLLRAL